MKWRKEEGRKRDGQPDGQIFSFEQASNRTMVCNSVPNCHDVSTSRQQKIIHFQH